MKRVMSAVVMMLAVAACGPSLTTGSDGGAGGGGGGAGAGVVSISSDVTVNTTWTADKTYVLKSLIYVSGAVLTIEPGTVVQGDRSSALVVTRDGRLEAAGTKDRPIVFTSSQPVGQRGSPQGDWGGLVFNGKAAVNVTGGENNAEGLADEPRNRYGGGAAPDQAHNCGTLKYVRVEFAGRPLTADNELNGVTLNACGSATTVDYLQVHRGVDDAVEIFGGAVNLKHLVLSAMDDDGLDWDQGWTGKGQFIVVQQVAEHGNYGIEADSNRTNNDLLPRSNPTLFNVTLVGRAPDTTPSEGASRGLSLRQGTAGTLSNFIVTQFTSHALTVDQAATATQWNAGALSIAHSLFSDNYGAGWTSPTGSTPDNQFDEGQALAAPSLSNRQSDPKLTDATNATAPNFAPLSDSPALLGGGVPPADGFFDTSATFIGAMGTEDWTAGWSAYPAN